LDIYFICLSEEAAKRAIIIAEELRDSNPSLTIKSNLGLESPSSQFKKADKSGAKIALIIGEEELLNDKISFKDLRIKSEQKKLSLKEVKSEISNSITNNHV
ncbi:His/Gly/Thr/Pro-type tRNA ligase C-terminal domain-containing protein, partial [Gammaproteobacteria bacterium]|nr:His/Gly/Thr/Pro-type tRNA ligase C-terminal domain-containing protein [Gammaproteobacteria bacterium]